MTPTIDIYYAEMCGLCHEAMDYFRKRGLSFNAMEVFWDAPNDRWVDDANSRRMLERAGPVDFVPQLFINGRHVKGWRSLEPLIASGEIDRLLTTPPA